MFISTYIFFFWCEITVLTFLAMKSVINRAARKHPAAIRAVRRFVDARIKSIPQKDEPRSGKAT